MSEPADGTGGVIRRSARVIGVRDQLVEIEADRVPGCAACAANAGCGAGPLVRGLAGGPVRVCLPVRSQVAVGDEVTLAIAAPTLLRAAFTVYMLPALLLAAVAALAAALGLADGLTALCLAAALALSFWRLRRVRAAGSDGATLTIDDLDATGPNPTRTHHDR